MQNEFGVFEPVFHTEHGSGYLNLLHLNLEGVKESVVVIKNLCTASPNPHADIGLLFENNNWRPHLVAAVALNFVCGNSDSFTKLWKAFDTGSWVSPQLAVVALLRDPNFSNQATSRIHSLCPVIPDVLRSMTPLERHSAAGPQGTQQRSAKAAATLVRLMQMLPAETEWLQTELSSPALQSLLASDEDKGGIIAERWHGSLKAILASIENG